MTKTKRKSRAKPVTLRVALDYLDKILVRQDQTSRELWNVLTALRGPDVDIGPPYDTKEATTVHIRRAAFPLCKTIEDYVNGATFFTSSEFAPRQAYRVSTHFSNHIADAAKALGLDLIVDDTKSTL